MEHCHDGQLVIQYLEGIHWQFCAIWVDNEWGSKGVDVLHGTFHMCAELNESLIVTLVDTEKITEGVEVSVWG